jgi:hypothetical protein
MIGNILIPIIWASGLLSLGALVSRNRKTEPELFFPAAGFLGLLIYAIGLMSAITPVIFWAITLIFAAASLWQISRDRVLYSLYGAIRANPLITAIVAIVSLPFVLAALSYPVTIDSLYFHLGLPKQYAHAGRIFFTEGNLFSAAPRTLEMIITGFFSLGFDRAGQFFVILIAAIFLWAVWRRAGTYEGNGGISVLLILSVPIFTAQVICAKNDFLLWGLCFFAICKFWDFLHSEKTIDIIWAGIGAGMAAGTKAIGLAIIGPLALLMIYNIVLGKYRFSHLLFLAFAFLLFCSPWYLYSWAITGNPFYPFFNSIFHSPYFPAAYEAFNNEIAVKTIAKSHFLYSPIELIFWPNHYDGRLGYAWLLFPAMLLFIRKIPSGIKNLIGVSLLFYPIWFFGFGYARFLMPVLSALAVAGSFAAVAVIGESRLLRSLLFASLAIALILPLPALYRDMAPRVKGVLYGESQFKFLSQMEIMDNYKTESAAKFKAFPYLDAWEYLKNNSSEDSKVGILTSFGTRADAYYLDRDFIYLNPSEQLEYNFAKLRDPEEIDKTIDFLGIDFIVIDSTVVAEFSPSSEWSQYPSFQLFSDGVKALTGYCNSNCLPVYSDSRYKIYKK